MKVYGIKNCDSCRKARKWLDERKIVHQFVDLREHGPTPETARRWIAAVGHELLINRRGTTWRKLAPADRDGIDAGRALTLVLAHPTLIKRPVFELPGGLLVGFSDEVRGRLCAPAV